MPAPRIYHNTWKMLVCDWLTAKLFSCVLIKAYSYRTCIKYQFRSDDCVKALPSERRLQCICSYVIRLLCISNILFVLSSFDVFHMKNCNSFFSSMFYSSCSICFMCVFFNVIFSSNLYLYNTVLSVLFCVNKDIIIK